MKHKNVIAVQIEKNALVDEGEGVVTFPGGFTITDGSEQWSGTSYDMATANVADFNGTVTADHESEVKNIVAEVIGLTKDATRVYIQGLRFALKNAYGILCYDLMTSGFLKAISTETFGDYADQEGVIRNWSLAGLSLVPYGNNKSAVLRNTVQNSIAQSKELGLDTTEVERFLNQIEPGQPDPETPTEPVQPEPKEPEQPIKQERNTMFVTVKNSRDFAASVRYKNAAGDEVETELAPGATIDVSEDQKEVVENQIRMAQAPQADVSKLVENAVASAVAPIVEKLASIEQNAFDAQAKAPEFVANGATPAPAKNGVTDIEREINAMDYREVHAEQISLAWNYLKGGDSEAAAKLRKINEINLGKLKENKLVSNSMTIADMGNFVISRELLTEIQGIRTDYTPLINATEWKDTLSTQMAWLERSGDIDMQPVEFLDDAVNGTWANANLKPVSNYTANIKTADLEELAAVTPVMNSATRFLAADLLSDVAAGYRTDFDRKRAQLIIARLQQAVDAHAGNALPYNVTSNVEGVTDFLSLWTKIGEKTPNGTYIMGTSSFSELMKRALSAGTNGPLANIFTQGRDGVGLIFNRPYIVVSDDLLPALNTTGTKSFTVNGTAVTVSSAVFYVNLANFTGRTSGGLNYDLSMEAAYEEGGVVKSAFQRNEMVLRGSFFRGGAIKDGAQVAALTAPGVS